MEQYEDGRIETLGRPAGVGCLERRRCLERGEDHAARGSVPPECYLHHAAEIQVRKT